MKLYLVKHIFECKRNKLASCITQIVLKYIQPGSPTEKKKQVERRLYLKTLLQVLNNISFSS